MQKIKKGKIAIAAVLIFSLLAVYGSVPSVKAVSLDLAKDILSDSSPSATGVTHTIVFDLGTSLAEGQYVDFTFEAGIDLTAANTVCPDNTTDSAPSAQVVRCTVDAGQTLSNTSIATTTVTDAENPSDTRDFTVTISSHQVGGAEIESSQVKIYIIEEVTVSAYVPATLTFSIATATAETMLNGEALTSTSSPTAINFGTLNGSAKIMGQVLSVSTNADDGFTVTVQQDGNLRNAAAADIDSYSTTSPSVWAAPTPNIDNENTWGHMGVTSNDTDAFDSGDFQGLDGTSPLTVFSHDGPANSTGDGAGTALVGYKVQVSAMQEAGDYQNTLTYVCTPTF